MDVIQDLSRLLLLLVVVYGVYAPCVLVVLEVNISPRQRLTCLCSCLLLSWLGYWLCRRYLLHE